MDTNNIKDKLYFFRDKIIDHGPNILGSIFIFIIFMIIATIIRNTIRTNINQQKYNEKSLKLRMINIESIIYYLIIFLGLFIALNNLGISNTTIFTIIGSFGFALGLGIQGLITNITSGIYIGLNELFMIGDKIKIGLFEGFVISYDFYNTQIIDKDGNKIIIPNSQIQSNMLTVYK